MAPVISKEVFLMHRAAREGRRALGEIQAMVHALAVAMRPLNDTASRVKVQLDESERRLAGQRLRHDRLYRTYLKALAAPTLPELEAARDAYVLAIDGRDLPQAGE
jgi:hypothetical protein